MHYRKSHLLVKLCLWLAGVGFAMCAVGAELKPEPLTHCQAHDYGELDQPSASYKQFAGKTIVAVEVLRINVFDTSDPRENKFLYRLMNKLHINTKEAVIRSQLLFAEGEALSAGAVAESERILRALPYLSYAAIHVSQVCEGGVALLVVTRDVWTTEPIVNFSREGGDTKSGIGFSEGNLFGFGSDLSLVFDKDAERSRTQYTFASPHLFNSHWRLKLGYTDTSDGQGTTFILDRPFYSLYSRWAMGLANIDTTLEEQIRFQDEVINVYKHEEQINEVFFGLGFGASTEDVHRVSLGVTQDASAYTLTENTREPLPVDSDFVYPWLQYRYIQDVFAVYRNLDLIHRVEDVPLGMDFRARLGYGGSLLANAVDFSYLDLAYSDVWGLGAHHILKFNGNAGGTWAKDETYSHRVWGGALKYYYLNGNYHRYYVSLSYDQGHNLLPHEQLTAGGENGLRGYPLDYQRGEKRALLSLENRYITPWHIFNLFRVGAVGFVDAGRAWGAGYSATSTLANVGLGLRLSSSKAKLDHIAHLDLAFPLVDRDAVDEYQVIMKAEARF